MRRRDSFGRPLRFALVVALMTGGLTGVIPTAPGGVTGAGAAKVVKAPGSLVKATPVATPAVHGTTYSLQYFSRWFPNNKLVKTTGLAFVPSAPAPPGGYPIVTWAHGTRGIADVCAPSRAAGTSSVPRLNSLLDRGWLVVASDYQGLGGPKTHPYLVGANAGRSVLDAVRAARGLSGVPTSNRYVVWGYSQGGHAAMFAANLAATYAPELQLRGTVPVAGPSNVVALLPQAKLASPDSLMLAAVGFQGAYGSAAKARPLFTKAGWKKAVALKKHTCLPSGVSFSQDFVPTAFSQAPWPALLVANDPMSFTAPSSAPVLLVYGGIDTTIPVSLAAPMTSKLCGLGQQLERWIYPSQGHGVGTNAGAVGDVIEWIDDRLSGQPPGSYVPSGAFNVQAATCA